MVGSQSRLGTLPRRYENSLFNLPFLRMFYNILYILAKSASSGFFFTDRCIIKNVWRPQSRLCLVRVVVGSFLQIHISALSTCPAHGRCSKNIWTYKLKSNASREKANPIRKELRGNKRKRGEDDANNRVQTRFQGLTEGPVPVPRQGNSL